MELALSRCAMRKMKGQHLQNRVWVEGDSTKVTYRSAGRTDGTDDRGRADGALL